MGRRPIPKDEKKMPSEYPMFAFRVSETKKGALTAQIEGIQTARNRRRKEDEPFVNKNDIIIEALELGLKALKKRE